MPALKIPPITSQLDKERVSTSIREKKYACKFFIVVGLYQRNRPLSKAVYILSTMFTGKRLMAKRGSSNY